MASRLDWLELKDGCVWERRHHVDAQCGEKNCGHHAEQFVRWLQGKEHDCLAELAARDEDVRPIVAKRLVVIIMQDEEDLSKTEAKGAHHQRSPAHL